jgi:hypothetical protein
MDGETKPLLSDYIKQQTKPNKKLETPTLYKSLQAFVDEAVNRGFCYSREHVRRTFLPENRWPLSGLAPIAEALGIKPEKLQKDYAATWYADSRMTASNAPPRPPSTCKEVMAAIDALHVQAREHTRNIGDYTQSLFQGHLGGAHCLFATSINVPPLILTNNKHDEHWIRARFQAISRGMLSALITPDRRLLDSLGKYCKIPANQDAKWENDFATYRSNLIRFLVGEQGMTDDSATRHVDRHVAHFRHDVMPFTPPFSTYSLLTEHAQGEQPKEWLLIRGPLTEGRVCVMPDVNRQAIAGMRIMVEEVLENEKVKIESMTDKGDAEAGRLEFVEEAQFRIRCPS